MKPPKIWKQQVRYRKWLNNTCLTGSHFSKPDLHVARKNIFLSQITSLFSKNFSFPFKLNSL